MKSFCQKDICSSGFTAASCTRLRQKQPQCPSVPVWIKKIPHTHTHTHTHCHIVQLLKKRRKFRHLQQHGWILRALYLVREDTHLSHKDKDKYCMFKWPICTTSKSQTHRNRVEWWLPGAGRWGSWEDVGQRVQTLSYKVNKFWESNIYL